MPNAAEISPELLSRTRAALEKTLAAGELEITLLPDVAVHILNNPMQDDTNIQELSALIQRDQVLAASVLRVVNSAAFLGDKRVTSLRQAVTRLGLVALRELVLAAVFKSRLFNVPSYEAYLQDIWQVSAITAAYAREVATACAGDVETAFLCGLLHNVGKPAILLALIDLGREVPTNVGCVALLEAVPDLQLRAGVMIADTWKLPDEIKTAIAFQDRWEEAPTDASLAKTTALAKLLTHNLLFPGSSDEKSIHTLPLCQSLGVKEESVTHLLSLQDKVAAFAESFG